MIFILFYRFILRCNREPSLNAAALIQAYNAVIDSKTEGAITIRPVPEVIKTN